MIMESSMYKFHEIQEERPSMKEQIDRFVNTGFKRKVNVDSILELRSAFGDSVVRYNDFKLFDGPSAYFHEKTMNLLEKHQYVIDEVIKDDDFVEALYATLAIWGLHRVGNRPNTMVSRDGFAQLLDELKSTVVRFKDYHLAELASDLSDTSRDTVDGIAGQLWGIIEAVEIAHNKARLVAGTKLLHHLLPTLVPPMDREYTLGFFYGNSNLNGRESEKNAFRQIFRSYFVIARFHKEEIEIIRGSKAINHMNTSFTKVLDNAIVGYQIGDDT